MNDFLKNMRLKLSLSIKQVVSELMKVGIDVSDKTIYGWESGHRKPDADTFIALCQIYGVERFPSIEANKNAISPEATEIARKYDVAPDHIKAIVKTALDYPQAQSEVESNTA